MDADAESGRCGDAESDIREYVKEVERCIFFRVYLGLGVWAAGQGLLFLLVRYIK